VGERFRQKAIARRFQDDVGCTLEELRAALLSNDQCNVMPPCLHRTVNRAFQVVYRQVLFDQKLTCLVPVLVARNRFRMLRAIRKPIRRGCWLWLLFNLRRASHVEKVFQLIRRHSSIVEIVLFRHVLLLFLLCSLFPSIVLTILGDR
jgi:hypothetical protein